MDDDSYKPPARLPSVPTYIWRYGAASGAAAAASTSTPLIDLSTQIDTDQESQVRVLDLTTQLDNERNPSDPQHEAPIFDIQDSPPRKSLADRIARRFSGKRQRRILDFPTAVVPTSTADKAIHRVCLARPRRDPV